MKEENEGSTGVKTRGMLIDKLARLPEDTILDEKSLADIIDVSARTLRRMVLRNELPPSIPLGGHAVWLAGRILQYLNSSAENAEKEALRERQRILQYSP